MAMEREFNNALKLVDQGYNVRTAYRMVAHAKVDNKVKDKDFNYDRETPKGE